MTDQLTAPMGQQPGTGVGPAGLHFSERTYAGNKMNQSAFSLDQNGNLLYERAHDGVGGYNYVFTPENRVVYVQDSDGSARGRLRLEAAYDGEGHRWLRRMWSEGGKALVSFRDATGKVTADFEEASASGGLKHVKDYVHVGSQLVAINSFCGPRPDLTLDSPTEQNGELRLFRTDYVPSQDGFKVLIRGASGQQKVLSRDASLATHFTIPLSELYPSETNLISIQTDASCGMTGYSNAVSYTYYPPQSPPDPPSCIGSMGISRSGFTGGSSTSLSLSATTTCTQGTRFNVYFLRDTGGPTIKLNGATLPASQLTLPNQPAGTGFGSYWFAPVNPATGIEGTAGPGSPFGIQNEDPDGSMGGGGGGGGTTNPPAVNAQYVHWDHLGSTRAISDEQGVLVASYKYYPFGMLADVSAGNDNRMMFTGHERDDSLGMDYMLARYHSPSGARFLSPDPLDFGRRSNEEQAEFLGNPPKWNALAYVLNDPMSFTDPDGLTEGSPSNVKKREQISEHAKSREGSTAWAKDVKKDDVPAGQNKCSKFVNDELKESGAPASVTTVEGTVRPPTAGELGNKNSKVTNWRVLGPSETPAPGDVAAYRFSGGTVGSTGHTGIVIGNDNGGGTSVISAHADKVSVKPDSFSGNPKTVYRRYIGE